MRKVTRVYLEKSVRFVSGWPADHGSVKNAAHRSYRDAQDKVDQMPATPVSLSGAVTWNFEGNQLSREPIELGRTTSGCGRAARVPTILCLRNISCRGTLGITILAIDETIFGRGRSTERRTKAIAVYVGPAAKWAWI